MECNTHIIEKKIWCIIPSECSDKLREKLEKKFNCKLMALKKTDSVHGAISIDHIPNKHVIRIDFYTKNEKPNDEHKSTLSKLSSIPSSKNCEECLK
mgnify:CR=1 FL=1